MKQTGMFWHVHHDVLVEYCHSYDERKEFILKNKPESERDLRLKLMQPVKGELPVELVEAWKKYDEAREKFDEAWKKYDEARKKFDEEIEALHAKECPDCSWNGERIIFED